MPPSLPQPNGPQSSAHSLQIRFNVQELRRKGIGDALQEQWDRRCLT